MPLPLPILDDRNFDELVREGRSLIPRYSESWTDHNLSDPGVTLLELLAFVTEALLFELDRVPDETLDVFLELVGICRKPGEAIEDAVVRALDEFEQTPVAVTAAEMDATARSLSADWPSRAGRAELVWTVDELCGGGPSTFGDPELGLLNVVLDPPASQPQPVLDRLFFALRDHVVVGTPFRVVQTEYATVSINAVVKRAAGRPLSAGDVEQRIRTFIDPLHGFEGSGWPSGRPLYRSELFQLLEAMPAVDHVVSLDVASLEVAKAAPGAEGVVIGPHELLDPNSSVQVEVR